SRGRESRSGGTETPSLGLRSASLRPGRKGVRRSGEKRDAEESAIEGLFDVADLCLKLALGLIGLSLGLQPGVADELARVFLGLALEIFGRAFEFVLSTCFHDAWMRLTLRSMIPRFWIR